MEIYNTDYDLDPYIFDDYTEVFFIGLHEGNRTLFIYGIYSDPIRDGDTQDVVGRADRRGIGRFSERDYFLEAEAFVHTEQTGTYEGGIFGGAYDAHVGTYDAPVFVSFEEATAVIDSYLASVVSTWGIVIDGDPPFEIINTRGERLREYFDDSDIGRNGNTPPIPDAHPGPSPYSIIPDPAGGDGFIGQWNPDIGRYEITGLPEDVTDQVMFVNAPFELFHSFYIDGVMLERGVHYIAEEGSTRVTILAQTLKDLDNGDHTATAAFSREDGSELLDIVTQDFTVNLDRSANAVSDNVYAANTRGADEDNSSGVRSDLEATNAPSGILLPFIIGAVAILAVGACVFVIVRKKRRQQ